MKWRGLLAHAALGRRETCALEACAKLEWAQSSPPPTGKQHRSHAHLGQAGGVRAVDFAAGTSPYGSGRSMELSPDKDRRQQRNNSLSVSQVLPADDDIDGATAGGGDGAGGCDVTPTDGADATTRDLSFFGDDGGQAKKDGNGDDVVHDCKVSTFCSVELQDITLVPPVHPVLPSDGVEQVRAAQQLSGSSSPEKLGLSLSVSPNWNTTMSPGTGFADRDGGGDRGEGTIGIRWDVGP